jgi:transmembrane sensor
MGATRLVFWLEGTVVGTAMSDRPVHEMAAEPDPCSGGGLPDDLLAEAAIWQARVRDAGAPDGVRRDFVRWLDADPRHRQAFDETERLFARLELPVQRILADHAPATPHAGPRVRRRFALIAGLAAACVAGMVWQGGSIDSDHATGIGERRPMTLADGRTVELNTNTAIAVDLDGPRREVRLLRGEAWFDVETDPDRPFVLRTDAGTIRVRGTSFNVRLDGERMVVSLVEGRVKLISAERAVASMILDAGWQAVVTSGSIQAEQGFDQAAVTAWQRGQLVFYDTPLAQVVEQLNRYRPGRIVLVGRDLAGLKVSGVFSTQDPDAALAAIRRTLPIEVTDLFGYLAIIH